MSIKIIDSVWEHSQQQGSALLMLLAIADIADEYGEAYPGVQRLADKTRMTVRNAQLVLNKLLESGELVIDYQNGVETGNGKTNRYRIITPGALPREGVKVASPVKREGVKSDARRGEILCSEGVKPPSPKPSVNRQINRQDHAPAPQGASPAPRNNTPRSDHQHLMDAYQAALGYPIPNGAAEGKAAKTLLTQGYTVDEIIACYQSLKRDPFWQGKHLSLISVAKQIGAWRAQPAPTSAPTRTFTAKPNLMYPELTRDEIMKRTLADRLGDIDTVNAIDRGARERAERGVA